MMSWAAANAPKARVEKRTQEEGSGASPSPSKKRRATETVEAALSRLSKAYTSSMECIGALNKTNEMLLKKEEEGTEKEEISDDALAVLERVSNAARKTLENGILLDPLVLNHVPTLNMTMQDFSLLEEEEAGGADDHHKRWEYVKVKRPIPPTLSSAAHKSTIRELTYLALVNYADLLLGCSVFKIPSRQRKDNLTSILDRGIVRKLKVLSRKDRSCWKGESYEDTQRLAVTALCDASNLDGSDPTVWLKLACAARGLELLVLREDDPTTLTTKYRRLQRYALERGSRALPPNMPPNRTVMRALNEINSTPEPQMYRPYLAEPETTTLTFELPRYSWAMLGRFLMKACREGADFQSLHRKQHRKPQKKSQFGSPAIELCLSPMLVLPERILGRICMYLENNAIWRFEATCRALSVSIMSARASMEKEIGMEISPIKQRENQTGKSESVDTKEATDATQPTTNANEDAANENRTDEQENNSGENQAPTRRSSRANIPPHLCRTSKRIRSQQITSGKKSERSWKRKSFDFCFVASTLSTTRHQHQEIMKKLPKIGAMHRHGPKSDSIVGRGGNSRNESSDTRDAHRREARERISGSSLPAFIDRWNGPNNSGPMDLMSNFLIHVANNVEDVFASDPTGAVLLTSCLLGCFEILQRRRGYQQGLTLRLFEPVKKTGSILRSLSLFATDLLHAELILRNCDRYSPQHIEFDDDSNQISMIVPTLLEACEELEEAISAHEDINKKSFIEEKFELLKVRCYWLAAGFYLWRSRISRMIWEAREAEEEGIIYILEAKKCFGSPALSRTEVIVTQHLVSPGRTEPQWQEISVKTLTKVRDDLQASSVVSLARQKFLNLVGSIEKEQGGNNKQETNAGGKEECSEADLKDNTELGERDPNKLSEADSEALSEIGEILLERYSFPYNHTEAKHAELVDDFLSCHGDAVLELGDLPIDEKKQKLQGMIPLGEVAVSDLVKMTNPSILTMLTICLRMKAAHRLKSFDLLVHVIMTSIDMHNSLIRRISDAKAIERGGVSGNDEFSDSDEESVISDDASIDRDAANKNADAKKARQCCHIVFGFIDQIRFAFSDHMSKEEQIHALSSNDTSALLSLAMKLSSNWFQTNVRRLSLPDDSSDQAIFEAVRNLISLFCHAADETVRQNFQVEFFNAAVDIFLLQRHYLESLVNIGNVQRTGRAARQKQCIKRAAFVRTICGELGNIFSQNLSNVEGFKMTSSEIFKKLKPNGDFSVGENESQDDDSKVHVLVDALMSLWRYSSKRGADSASAVPNQPVQSSYSSFDKPVVKEIRVAIATVVIGLCGSATSTRPQLDLTLKREDEDAAMEGDDGATAADQLDLVEFFDSDASPVDWDLEDSSDETKRSRKELLRAICHAVHCITQVLAKIEDKEALSFSRQEQITLGPVLPLVAARVLNHFADSILLNFEDEDGDEVESPKPPDLWAEEFPIRTRTIGELLDSNLHKAYRWLHGFVLVGEKAHNSSGSGKDALASTVAPLTELAVQNTVPESTAAAAQLYRCIVRAYGSGRRSPPKASLELVSSALPPLQEREESKNLRDFLFTSRAHQFFSLEDVVRVVKREEGWVAPFEAIRDFLDADTTAQNSGPSGVDEAMLVRRGISSQLAKGPLPVATADSGKQKSDGAPEDDRSSTFRFEEELSKKFFVILDDICLGGMQNGAEGFYRAAQCLSMKAEVIADRLGFSKGFSRSSDFIAPESRSYSNRFVDPSQLERAQIYEATMQQRNWVEHLGNDLSVYTRHNWSSFQSLLSCSAAIGSESSLSKIGEAALREIESLYHAGQYLEWQEAWGGIFVRALRKLSLRFMCVAVYETHSGKVIGNESELLKSELRETIGTALYTELMASQVYGYPMQEMAAKRKRDIAIASKQCFQAAVDILGESAAKDDESDSRATWDLIFMIGKCDEKVAKTHHQENFSGLDGESIKPRLYEKYMAMALQKYSEAYEQAKSIEDDGGFIIDQSGGSAHGSTEILYRIMASRLKCLIWAVSCSSEYLKVAEEEALRLTECHWFNKNSKTEQPDGTHIRDRVWDVLADVVSGLAQCRMNQHYFHRSVYRHAQALMWAPTLYDPTQCEGSLGHITGTKGYMIRGLNNSTHAANSAEVVMSSLFDKRRSQLVAVWVTHTAVSSPFQILNSSTRKYDSLRGKYIMAYLESLRLCQRRPELEQFLKWTSVTKRDLPSYFQASALAGGKSPPKLHTHDNLLLNRKRLIMSHGFLITVKRQANSALAYVIQEQINALATNCSNNKSSDPEKKKTAVENNLKHAYACYLRLHCTKDDLTKRRAFSYGGDTVREVDTLCQAYLALDSARKEVDNANDFGDWSGGARKSHVLDAALEKCRTLFPSTSGSFFSKKQASKSKGGGGGVDAAAAADDGEEPSTGKRKQAGEKGTKAKRVVSYEVAVPAHLKEGDTFLTSVKVGNGTQKVKLTVPKGRPSTLRFKLSTTTDGPSPPAKKAKKDGREE